MSTIGKMISDVELRLYGGKPSDDSTIQRKQIRFWLDVVNADLLTEWIRAKNQGIPPQNIIQKFDCISIKTDSPVCYGGCITNYYIELPKNNIGGYLYPLNLPLDKGINQLMQGERPIYPVQTPAEIRSKLKIRFNVETSYYYRVREKLFLLNGVFPDFSKLTLYMAASDSTGLTEDDEFPSLPDIENLILSEAEKIGKREMGMKMDLLNNGTDVNT